MIEVFIKSNSLSQSIIEQNEIRWKLYFYKIRILLIVLTFASFFSLALGLTTDSDFAISFGVVIFLVLLYGIRLVAQMKKRLIKSAQELAKLMAEIDEIHYILTEEEIIIEHQLLYRKINWKLFNHKVFYDKFIFLNYYDNDMDGVAIIGNLMPQSDFDNIRAFINEKVKTTPK